MQSTNFYVKNLRGDLKLYFVNYDLFLRTLWLSALSLLIGNETNASASKKIADKQCCCFIQSCYAIKNAASENFRPGSFHTVNFFVYTKKSFSQKVREHNFIPVKELICFLVHYENKRQPIKYLYPQIRNRIKVKRFFDLFDMGYREKEIMKITTENENSS